MALQINIALTTAVTTMRAGIGLTLIDHTCTVREARGFFIDSTSIEELEKAGAEAAFQWVTCWSGHRISFRSDSEPTLMLLVGMYAEARRQRYLISEDFGNTKNFDINFLAQDFTLVIRNDVIWAASLSSFCKKYEINHNWVDFSLRALIIYLNIQPWNENVMNACNSSFGVTEQQQSIY